MQSSKKQMKIKVNDVEYLVQVRELGGGLIEVTVNGTGYRINVEDLEGEYEGEDGAVQDESSIPEVSRSVEMSGNADQVTAPMPGDVVEVIVKPGDQVEVGQALCVLEAMKMKNVIRSPLDKKINSVEVSPGQSVDYGTVLVRFD